LILQKINTYQEPESPIKEMADAELAPVIRINTKATLAFLMHRRPYKELEELAAPELKLAGLRINPKTNIQSRESHFYKISLLDILDNSEHEISGLPEKGKFCRLSWNYEQDKAIVLNIESNGVQAWIIDVIDKTAKAIGNNNINGNISQAFVWLKSDEILFSTIPAAGVIYQLNQDTLPSGPITADNEGQSIESRTFQDLLRDEIDAQNFEKAVTSEIWKFKLDGSSVLWKKAAMHDGIALSPDGSLIMISEIEKPFSYFVPFDRFPYTTTIFDQDARPVYEVERSPLLEFLPQGFMAVQKGRRHIKWRPDKDATLIWVEALDEGDPEKEVNFRDEIFQLSFPFHADPVSVFKTKDRFAGIFYTENGKAVVFERWWKNRMQKTYILDTENSREPILFEERNFQDRFNNPGNFVTKKNNLGWNVIQEDDNGDMYLNGDGYYAGGRKAFLDKYNLHTGKKTRVFEADDTSYQEDISMVINATEGLLLTLIQDSHTYPTFFIRNLQNNSLKQITFYKNPFYALEGVKQEIIKYKRKDGTELSARLYIPVNHDGSTKLPLIMWAYPMEFKDQQTAGQSTNGKHDFIYPFWGSPLYWVAKGYAIMDDVSFPIIGENDTPPNDHFHEQMIANAEAAIEAARSLKWIDVNRIAIGGHSYGAFMVSYLLTHTSLFAAGIARSGAYNRTLTPFGFQSEERNLWQAKDVYQTMNPFMDADKMRTPLLLIHGKEDNNSGTYTMQTERYYAALKALGATVRMVLLPFESHSYQSRQSILHVLWEQDQWLEKYVKNKPSTF
jgi:dipeptidyl aminopeptidase/acylaminoacyl peptidase